MGSERHAHTWACAAVGDLPLSFALGFGLWTDHSELEEKSEERGKEKRKERKGLGEVKIKMGERGEEWTHR